MRSKFFSVATLFCLALPALHAQTPALHGGPMLECSGLPCVDIITDKGKHLRMLIDAGDVSSILDTAVAKDMGLTTTPVNGADGKPVPGYMKTELTGIMVGDASLGNVRVLVMDIATDIKKDRMPQADGTLAYTAFKDRLLELDYEKKTVHFSAPLTGDIKCPGFCGDITYPTFGKQGPPIVVSTGFTINQKPVTVQIDTLYSGTMLIYPTSVDKLGLSAQSASSTEEFFPYTDGGVKMLKSEVDSEAFGSRVLAKNVPVYFATPDVHVPDGLFDGTVGHALFKGLVLTLDLHSNHAWIS